MEKFESAVKLFIRDIHTMKRHPDDTNYYIFNDTLIRRVDIMGVITEVRQFDDTHLYRVDDGTGEVLCRYDHLNKRTMQEAQEIETCQKTVDKMYKDKPDICTAMKYILEETSKASRQSMTALKQGVSAHIIGFIHNFHDVRQVNAYILNEVPLGEHEIDRIFEVSALYSTVYSKKRGVK